MTDSKIESAKKVLATGVAPRDVANNLGVSVPTLYGSIPSAQEWRKERPEFPAKGFASLAEARAWAAGFVHWRNVDHRHSGIRYVTPAQRHVGDDAAILAARHVLYLSMTEATTSLTCSGAR